MSRISSKHIMREQKSALKEISRAWAKFGMNMSKYALESVAQTLSTTSDNMERALASKEKEDDDKSEAISADRNVNEQTESKPLLTAVEKKAKKKTSCAVFSRDIGGNHVERNEFGNGPQTKATDSQESEKARLHQDRLYVALRSVHFS